MRVGKEPVFADTIVSHTLTETISSTANGIACCRKGHKLSQLRVIVGEHNRSHSEGTGSTLTIDRIVRHPLYSKGTFRNNDIALVKLKGSLEFRREVAPVCLPLTEISPGTVCVTTGWGRTRGRYSPCLFKLTCSQYSINSSDNRTAVSVERNQLPPFCTVIVLF